MPPLSRQYPQLSSGLSATLPSLPPETENHHQGRGFIWEAANHSGPSLNLLEGSFDDIAGADMFPVTLGEAVEGEAFLKVSG